MAKTSVKALQGLHHCTATLNALIPSDMGRQTIFVITKNLSVITKCGKTIQNAAVWKKTLRQSHVLCQNARQPQQDGTVQ
jgi:hypothetical protein